MRPEGGPTAVRTRTARTSHGGSAARRPRRGLTMLEDGAEDTEKGGRHVETGRPPRDPWRRSPRGRARPARTHRAARGAGPRTSRRQGAAERRSGEGQEASGHLPATAEGTSSRSPGDSAPEPETPRRASRWGSSAADERRCGPGGSPSTGRGQPSRTRAPRRRSTPRRLRPAHRRGGRSQRDWPLDRSRCCARARPEPPAPRHPEPEATGTGAHREGGNLRRGGASPPPPLPYRPSPPPAPVLFGPPQTSAACLGVPSSFPCPGARGSRTGLGPAVGVPIPPVCPPLDGRPSFGKGRLFSLRPKGVSGRPPRGARG